MLYFAIVVYLNVINTNITIYGALFNIVVLLLSSKFGKKWSKVSTHTCNILKKQFWQHVNILKTYQIKYVNSTGGCEKNL